MTDGSRLGRTRVGVWVAIAAVVLLVAGVGLLVERTATERPAELPPDTAAEPTPVATAPDLVAQVEEIAAIVEEMRELTFEDVPAPRFVTQQEVAEQIAEDLEGYTEQDAALDRRLLAALGAVAADADLRALLLDTLSEQVAGRYDQDTGDLVVVAEPGDEELGPTDRVTLVHELGHALVDQRIGLPDLGEEIAEGREDAAFAAQAVVEGDATLLMLLYAQRHLTPEEQRLMADEQRELAGQMEALDALPHYVRRTLMFPYDEGTLFAAQVQQQRGWRAMDAALAEPPVTSLEILAPDRYLDGQGGASTVRDPGDPGEGWERETRRSFGAADLLFLFEAPGDDRAAALPEPLARATAWRGGEIVLWGDGEDDLLAVSMVGQDDLCASVGAWYRAAFPGAEEQTEAGTTTWTGPERDAHLACAGDEVRLGIGPDAASARTVTE